MDTELIHAVVKWSVSKQYKIQKNSSNSSSFNSSIRLIRHFFVGPGRIPIFCIHFCSPNSPSSNSSVLSIRHLSIPEKRFVRVIRHLQFCFRCLSSWYVWGSKQIKDLYLGIAEPRNLFIEFIHEVRSATGLPIERKGKSVRKIWKVLD